ncbi:MAG: YopX family protein [Clostridia bacterium]
MNREILFRAKRVDNGEWVIGSLLQGITHDKECTIIVPRSELFSMIGTSFCEECNRHYDIDYEVHPETVGEFTGLKDRKGKRIFNGDILERLQNGFIYGVHFYNGGYHIIDADGYVIKPTQKAVSYMQVEVIGNIHDNPELLEVEE